MVRVPFLIHLFIYDFISPLLPEHSSPGLSTPAAKRPAHFPTPDLHAPRPNGSVEEAQDTPHESCLLVQHDHDYTPSREILRPGIFFL